MLLGIFRFNQLEKKGEGKAQLWKPVDRVTFDTCQIRP
jgi:hypothetical protein